MVDTGGCSGSVCRRVAVPVDRLVGVAVGVDLTLAALGERGAAEAVLLQSPTAVLGHVGDGEDERQEAPSATIARRMPTSPGKAKYRIR